ncbi:Cenpp [Phodopus roborovskii]|uniref:Cenpp protein n=1 Tax=Phodopus roborovskii TaxID=109678 RepID=A0AAU9ZP91_PHORO|nr:Cenpp [Phodopus roborovskii]
MDPETRELRALEAEVAALQRECSMLSKPWRKTSGARKSFKKFPQSDSEGWESLEDLKSQLGHLKSELSFLSKLTGINIRSYSKTEDITNNEVTDNDTKKILQRHRISGNCNMVTFQLEFQVLEIETKEKLSSVITDLNIIMEPTEYSELSEFASRAEEKRDLLMFFQSLHFFVEWYEYRKNTLEHFKLCLFSPVWNINRNMQARKISWSNLLTQKLYYILTSAPSHFSSLIQFPLDAVLYNKLKRLQKHMSTT